MRSLVGFGEGRHDIRPSQRRIDELDVLASGGVVDHAALRFGLELAASGSSSTSGGSLAGAADASVVIDNLIAEGDRVVAFWTLEGTHAGMLFRDAGHRAFLHRSRRQHASDRRRTDHRVRGGGRRALAQAATPIRIRAR
jgi:hypothetical protein